MSFIFYEEWGHQFIGGGVIYDGPKIPRFVEENIQQQHRVRNQHNLRKKEKKKKIQQRLDQGLRCGFSESRHQEQGF